MKHIATRILSWLTLHRICAWCSKAGKPAHMGGNPFARRVTHGICPRCREQFLADLGAQ